MRPPPAPSGEQFEIVLGEQRATLVEVGGGIRVYTADGRDVLEPYPLDAMCDGAHGMPLLPWPNRLSDGRYTFDGSEHQLALTEPELNNAIHGLLRWHAWRPVERTPERVAMGVTLHPQPGYPFALELRIVYELREAGLEVTTSATNVGRTACPFGGGQHPYLSAGGGTVDDCVLEVPAATRILTDERMLPAGREPVAGTSYDFRTPTAIGTRQIDSAYTDLERGAGGLATVRLRRADGATAELWVDESYPYVEVFTGDGLSADRARRGLAAEPMTCPPNAFQSGEGLAGLDPGERLVSRWGVRLS
jgi:aldose 1-epimerase